MLSKFKIYQNQLTSIIKTTVATLNLAMIREANKDPLRTTASLFDVNLHFLLFPINNPLNKQLSFYKIDAKVSIMIRK